MQIVFVFENTGESWRRHLDRNLIEQTKNRFAISFALAGPGALEDESIAGQFAISAHPVNSPHTPPAARANTAASAALERRSITSFTIRV